MADEEKVIIEVKLTGDKDADKKVDKLGKSTKDAKKESKEYSKSLQENAKDVRIFGVSVNSLSAAFGAARGSIRASITGLKAFKIALAATGIGLLVIALGALFTFFQKSRAGADSLSDGLAVVGEIIQTTLQFISGLGSALVKLFKGDIRGAIETVTAEFKGFNDELRRNISLRLELEALTRAADQFDRDAIVRRATLEKDIQKELLISRDFERATSRERLAAVNRAIILRKEQIKLDTDQAILRQNIAVAEFARLDAEDVRAEDAQEARNKAIANTIAVQTRGNAQLRELRNRITTETAVIRREQDAADKATADAQSDNAKNFAEANKIANQEILDDKINLKNRIVAVEQEQLDETKAVLLARVAIEDEKNRAIAEGAAAVFGGLAALIGQNSVFGKAAAIAEATINSFVAGTASLKIGGPLGIASLISTIAVGLATVKRILGVPLPEVNVIPSSFALGGDIRGPAHSRGGVNINAEGGEYIISKDRMRIPGVRSAAMRLNNFKQSKQNSFALGGMINTDPNQFLVEAIRKIENIRPVLVTEDVTTVINRLEVQEANSTI